MNRHRNIVLCAAVLALAATARADSVKLKSGLTYDEVTVADAGGGVIVFRTSAGSAVSKSLADVAAVELTGQDGFNAAEKLLAGGKAAEAADGYAAVDKTTPAGWRKALVRYRLLAAYDAADKFDQAVKLWLEIVQAKPGPGNIACRPVKLPPAGSPQRAEAVKLLREAINKTDSQSLRAAIDKLLAELKEEAPAAEKPETEQPAPAEKPAVANENKPSPAPVVEPPPAPAAAGTADGTALIRQAAESVKAGRGADAIKLLESNLDSLSSSDLPGGLYYLGMAQLELAKKDANASGAHEKLLKAGLNLMRVATSFGASEYAPQALLAAGEVNERLGNLAAAQAAYKAVVSRYGETESAQAAKDALESVKNRNKTKL